MNTLNGIKLYHPYRNSSGDIFEIVQIIYNKNEEPKLKIMYSRTETLQIITLNQFRRAVAKDPYGPDVLKLGYSDGYNKSYNYDAWKLWVDILLACFDPTHKKYRDVGATGKILANDSWVHFSSFLKMYEYRKYIGMPVLNYMDNCLYINPGANLQMVRMI